MASAATLPSSGCAPPHLGAGSSLSKASFGSAQLPPPHPPAPHAALPTAAAAALPTKPVDPVPASSAVTGSPSLPQPRPIFRQWQPHCSLHHYLHHSPSLLSGLPLPVIRARHGFALSFLSSLASHLRFPFRVLTTATALYHLTFFRVSLTAYSAADVAVASLFIACKVEDAPRKLLEVVRGWMELELQAGDAAAAAAMDSSEKEEDSDAAAEQEDEDAAEQEPSPFRSLDGSVELDEERNAAAERLRRSKQAAVATADSETEPERQRRVRLLHLESEILLAADYNFSLPQPAAYLRSLLRSLTQLPPLSPALAATAEGVRWRVTAEAVARPVEALYCSAMALLKSGLKSSASLHFSPQAIAVACVMLAALDLDLNLHHVAELTEFTSALPSPPSPPPTAAASVSGLHDESAPDSVAFSPSSSTSALSPLYSESPSSPSSSSPASLTSLSSALSHSLALPAKTAEAPHTVAAGSPASAFSSSMQQSPPPPWYRALLPALSDAELLSLLVLLLDADPSSPLCLRLRKLHPFSQALQPPQSALAGKAALELVDVLGVRAEFQQELAVRMAEWREKEETERKAKEEQEKALREAREAAEAELKARQREEEERKEREPKRAQEEPQARRDRTDRLRAASPRRRPSIDRAEERTSSSISSGSSSGWRARDSSYREHKRDWRERRSSRDRDRDRDREKDRERDRDKERRPQASGGSAFVSTVRPSGFISTTTAGAGSGAAHRAGQPLPVSRPARRSRSPSPQSPPSKRRRRRPSPSPPRSVLSRSGSRSPDSRRGRRRDEASVGSGGERRPRRRRSRSDDSGSSDDERGRVYRRPPEQPGDRSGRRSGDPPRRR